MNIDRLLEKLDSHDKNLSDLKKEIKDGFQRHHERFDAVEKRMDLHAMKLLEHEDLLKGIQENMAARSDLGKVLTGLDGILVIAKRLDVERISNNARLKRIETHLGINHSQTYAPNKM